MYVRLPQHSIPLIRTVKLHLNVFHTEQSPASHEGETFSSMRRSSVEKLVAVARLADVDIAFDQGRCGYPPLHHQGRFVLLRLLRLLTDDNSFPNRSSALGILIDSRFGFENKRGSGGDTDRTARTKRDAFDDVPLCPVSPVSILPGSQ